MENKKKVGTICLWLLALLAIIANVDISCASNYSHVESYYNNSHNVINEVHDMALDQNGNLFVVTGDSQVAKFDKDGNLIKKWALPGTGGSGICVDQQGNVYVSCSYRLEIYEFDNDGTYIKSFDTGQIYIDSLQQTVILAPTGIVVDANGNIYTACSISSYYLNTKSCIAVFNSDGQFVRYWEMDGSLNIALDKSGNFYSTNGNANRVLKYSNSGLLIATWSLQNPTSNGLYPYGISVDFSDIVYVADKFNYRIQIFDGSGAFIEQFIVNYSAFGSQRQLRPTCVEVDSFGDIYVSEGSIVAKYSRNTILLPEAEFIVDVVSGIAPLTVKFTDQSKNADSLKWEFGDGNTSAEKNLTYTYTKPGNYVVKLIASNSEGSDEYSQQIEVKDIDFDVNPDKIRISDNVEFDAYKYLGEMDGNIVWDFGDGTKNESGNSIVYHNYSEPKTYIVKLTVTDSAGVAREVSKNVNVTIPVVLVHGFLGSSDIWQGMSAESKKNGFEVWNFDYRDSNTADPRTISLNLSSFIVERRNDLSYNGQKYNGKIDIVCHSMGAIITRLYMEKDEGGIHGKEVRQWIGIAPAHGGSAGADLGATVTDASPALFLAKWIFCPALDQLKTTSSSVTSLGPLSPKTKYWVIAGWNPTHNPAFGSGLSATRAKDKTGSYYWTYTGDMIIAVEQGYREDMEFEPFPSISRDLGGSPAYEFDHLHIHSSPKVISYVVDCLKDINKRSSKQKPPEDKVPFLMFAKNVISGLVGSSGKQVNIPTSDLIPIGSNNGPASSGAEFSASSSSQTASVPKYDAFTVMLDWEDGDVGMTLVSPSGAQYTADSHPDNVWYMKEDKSISFIIANPESGDWKASLIPVSYPGHDINYNITCIGRSSESSESKVTPIANFNANVTEGFAPFAVKLADHSENAAGIKWYINSAYVSEASVLEYLFTAPGLYNVTLEATNDNGTDSISKDINVTARPFPPAPVTPVKKPKAGFSTKNDKGNAPLTVQFIDKSKNSPTRWAWDFGDKIGKSDQQNPSYIYMKPGKYTVTLIVNNAVGTDTKTIKNCVKVKEKKKDNK